MREVLRAATIAGDHLIHDGRPLTLGDLKRLVSREISRLGMLEDHDTILSQGRDAGIPHSRGDADAIVRPSVPIVLDIFPADRETGYFFDLTRTFCVGPIPDELRRIHADVLEAFELARDAMRAGTLASSYQALVCDFFEATRLRDDPLQSRHARRLRPLPRPRRRTRRPREAVLRPAPRRTATRSRSATSSPSSPASTSPTASSACASKTRWWWGRMGAWRRFAAAAGR